MFQDLYQHLPEQLNPIAFSIGFFSLRWYALSYILGFMVVYFALYWRVKNNELEYDAQISDFAFSIFNKFLNFKFQVSNLILDFILIAFGVAILTGRIGFVLLYDLAFYLANPIAIISPFNQVSGAYVGIYGMSYYGALVGVLAAAWFFCRRNKLDFFAWGDFIVPAIPAGYFFGRIGNFLNGELFGRITNLPIGMYFSNDPNFLRHPSQLYEALGEGLFLFLVFWLLRNKKYRKGTLFFGYIFSYAFIRFWIEFFRQPDPQIGLFMKFFSLGQILSFIVIVFTIVSWLVLKKKLNNDTLRLEKIQ